MLSIRRRKARKLLTAYWERGEQRMRAKRIAALCAVMGIIVLLPTGCGDSIQSEEEIVIPKEGLSGEEQSGQQEEGNEEEREEEAPSENLAGIAELVSAPEQYTWEGSSGDIRVTVDAPVKIPQAEGFKSYKVTSRVFTQEDYDRVNDVLLKGGKLWDRAYEMVVESEERPASETNKESPVEPVIVEVSPVVSYTERRGDTEENTENDVENWLYGYVTVEGEDYFVSLDNDLREDWRWISFTVKSGRELGNYYPIGEKPETSGVQISTENVKSEAEELIADMGFTDFAAAGEEYCISVSTDKRLDTLKEQVGYGVHFTRLLDGIPVTYTDNEGTTVEAENGAECSWPYEKIDMVFDQKGFTEFVWTNPCQVEKLSDENVFLLSFSDIQNIFQEMIFKKYQDFWGETQVKEELRIREVRLGYMRVMEKGNVTEGTMVPVWDFFGSETFSYDKMAEPVTEDAPYKCLLTINAMDGTIIDRDLGY